MTHARNHIRNITIAIAFLIGLMAPVEAYAGQKANSSETTPTPTATTTRKERGERTERLRGEGDWVWIDYGNREYMAALRYDMESSFAAELMVDMFADPDTLESELDLYYEGSLRVRGGYCEGVELYDPDLDESVYMAICADGEYVNLVMGTNKADVLEGIGHMQDGDVPHVDGYEEED